MRTCIRVCRWRSHGRCTITVTSEFDCMYLWHGQLNVLGHCVELSGMRKNHPICWFRFEFFFLVCRHFETPKKTKAMDMPAQAYGAQCCAQPDSIVESYSWFIYYRFLVIYIQYMHAHQPLSSVAWKLVSYSLPRTETISLRFSK